MFSYRQNASGQTLLRQLRRLQYPTVQRPLWPSYQHPLRSSSIQSLLSRFLFSSCVFFLWADKKLHCFTNKKLLQRYNIWIFKNKPVLALDSIQFRSTPPVSTINSFKSRGVPPPAYSMAQVKIFFCCQPLTTVCIRPLIITEACPTTTRLLDSQQPLSRDSLLFDQLSW